MFSLSLKDVFKNLILVVVFILGVCSKAFGFSINSTDFDQRIDIGGYREFVLENKTDKPIRYKFDIKKGENAPDMSEWVKVYPKVMNIPPLEKRTLKMYAQSPSGTKPGEYAFNLIVTPLVVPVIKESEGKITGTSSISFVPMIEMLGYVGNADFEKNINVENIEVVKNKENKIDIKGKIINNSFAGFHIGLKFLTSNGSVMDGRYLGRIPKNKSSDFKVTLDGRIKDPKEITEVVVYDALNLTNLKTILLILRRGFSMKKLLLGALLVVGATSFAGVEGKVTEVALPIRSVGEIVDPSKGNLMIESTTAGMAGNVMQFDFGDVAKPTETWKSPELTGTFKVTRTNGQAILTAETYDTLAIGLDEAATALTATGNARTGVTINYTLNGKGGEIGSTATKYEGNVVAQATIENNAELGTFVDASNKIYVKVSKKGA